MPEILMPELSPLNPRLLRILNSKAVILEPQVHIPAPQEQGAQAYYTGLNEYFKRCLHPNHHGTRKGDSYNTKP